jgi:hypothetical protein
MNRNSPKLPPPESENACTCAVKCEDGGNSSCPVCSIDITSCIGEEAAENDEYCEHGNLKAQCESCAEVFEAEGTGSQQTKALALNGSEGGSEPIVDKQVSEDGKTVTETTTLDGQVISTVVTVTDSENNKTTVTEYDGTAEEGTVTKTTVTDTSTDNAKVVTEYVGKAEDGKVSQVTEYNGDDPAKTTVYDDNGDVAKTIEYNAELTGAVVAMMGLETGTVEKNANGDVVKETIFLDANYLPWGMGQVCVIYASFIYSGEDYDAALENVGGTFYEDYNFVMVEDICDKNDPTIVWETATMYYGEDETEYSTTYYYLEEDIAEYGYKTELVRNLSEDWSITTSYYDDKIVTANYVPPQTGWGTNGYEYNTVFLDENGDPTGVTEYLFTIGVLDQEDIITDAGGNVTKTTYEYTHGTANDSIITTTKYENDVKTYSSISAYKNKLLISDSVFDVDADGNLLKTTSTTYAEDGETPTEAVVQTYKGGEVVQTTTSTYKDGALASSVTKDKDEKVIEETTVADDGSSVTTKYDANGEIVSTTTTSAPDEDGSYTVKQVNADGSSVVSTVDEDGNLINSVATAEDGSSTETVIDADGTSVVTVKDAEGETVSTTTTSPKSADGSYKVVVEYADGTKDERVYSADGSYVKTGFKPEISQNANEYTGYNRIIVRSTDELCNFLYVTIDGTIYYPISGYYDVSSGSIIVSLKNSFLNTLSAGSHSVGIVSTNGSVATSFTISQATYNRLNGSTSTPRTGDSSNLVLFSALLLVSFSGLVYIPLTLRKRAK